MSTIQILDKQTLSEKKYPLKYISFEKPDAEGEFHNLEKEVYFRPDTVAILLVDEKHQKLLLTKQFRLATFLNGNDGGYLVEACAGIIDENETPEQTAYREAEEETSYKIENLEKIASAYTSPAGITEFEHLFMADYTSTNQHPRFGGLKEEGESIELIELSFDDAFQKLRSGAFRDMKTIALLQHFFMNRNHQQSAG
jgi:nudix-type nucleoside diphosphatase (YffH/AdpP family)